MRVRGRDVHHGQRRRRRRGCVCSERPRIPGRPPDTQTSQRRICSPYALKISTRLGGCLPDRASSPASTFGRQGHCVVGVLWPCLVGKVARIVLPTRCRSIRQNRHPSVRGGFARRGGTSHLWQLAREQGLGVRPHELSLYEGRARALGSSSGGSRLGAMCASFLRQDDRLPTPAKKTRPLRAHAVCSMW